MQNDRKKRRRLSRQGAVLLLALSLLIIFCLILVIVLTFGASRHSNKNRVARANPEYAQITTEAPTQPTTEPPTEAPLVEYPVTDADTMLLDGELQVGRALLIDVDNNRVVAMKGQPDARIYPASMTKMLTLVTAIEHLSDAESDHFTFTEEILNPLYEQEASMAGFQAGERVTLDDLLYAAALPSGADGTTGLALVTAGSEELFVDWMNDTVEKLGLKNTHFMNASGLHDENHYSTPEDIALILEYCMQNDDCRRILATYTYTTSQTDEHPDGIELYSTMFSRMYGTEVDGIKICGGKTGYTDEAGQCLANWAETPDGHRYIAVTAQGLNKWHNVFDSFRLYGIVTGTYDLLVPEETEDVSIDDEDTAD